MLPVVKARLPLLLAMAALLLVAVVASRGRSAVHPGSSSLLPVHRDTPPAPAPAKEEQPNIIISTIAAIGLTGVLLVFTALFLVGLAVIVMSVRVTRTRRRGRLANPFVLDDPGEGTDGPGVGAALMRSAVAAARDELGRQRSGPPSDAVIAAWLRLEQAAAESGLVRAPHQTPTEFTTALLGEHLGVRGDRGAVDRLRGLYQRARFGSSGSVTEADADAAHDALGAILDAWRVSA